MVRITISRDDGQADVPDTVALIKLVRQARNCSLEEARPVVDACVRGEMLMLEVPSFDDVQAITNYVVEAGFNVIVDIADDIVLDVAWKHS